MAHHKIEFPCGVPELSWWEGMKIPTFRHIENLELKILDVDSIICTNLKGQVINTARAFGVDKVNAASIKENLEAKGVDSSYFPGVVLDTNELIDGFTRQSVLVELKQQKWVYLQGKLATGSTIEDAKDEVGLGLNNHSPSKRATKDDFRARLRNYIDRQGDRKVTKKECIDWVNAINHSFTQEGVDTIVNETLNAKETDCTMEPFTKVGAKNRGAKLLNLDRNDVVAFDNKSGASFERSVIDVINHYGEYSQFPAVVAFTNRTASKDALSARIRMKEVVDKTNETLRTMFKEYRAAEKRGKADEFEVIQLKGFLPQIIDGESGDEIVTVE